MTGADRERLIVQHLSAALELDDNARRSFLDEACGADADLREELEALLAEESAVDDGFLEVPVVAGLTDTRSLVAGKPSPTPPMPDRLGPYRVVEKLGRGGMGTVYLGEQEQPVRRRVALKVIDAIHDLQRVKRFKLECQALAHLSHPNVASLYEVGATDDDHPFVAMELVEGTEITTWCDHNKLRLGGRIELFLGVCAGVRHAHEKGILHRDLKPSNVLVAEVDGRPTAKVIDFGIARALDEPLLADTPPMTLEHQIVGSPAYMSPETASGDRDVDTRSDVYSLGILLYELIAGVLPFDLGSESLGTLLGRLSRGDLPALSKRFADLDREQKKQIAECRGLQYDRLLRRMRGDLDAILRKAIARDRDQRYSSPADLAADLERHLEHRPIEARPPSFSYGLGCYLRRRTGVVLSVAALILALTAGVVASTREARRANLEAERASLAAQRAGQEARRARQALAETQEVSRFLVDLFEVADPERNADEPVDVRELLDRSAERLRHELVDQPLARARFLHTIGDIYTNMALLQQAETLVAEALELREVELPVGHPDLLESVNQLGVIYRRLNRLDEAEPLLRRVLTARETAAVSDPLAVAQALNNLGNLLWNQQRLDEAEVVHRRALEIRERELEPGHQDLAETLNNLGVLLRSQRRYEEAEPYLRRATEIFAQAMGTEHPRRAAALQNLGLVEQVLGRWQQAETHLREAVATWQTAYGKQHPRTLMARRNLASLLRETGREAESARLLRDILRIQESSSGSASSGIATTLTGLGFSLGRLGSFEPAEAAFGRVLAIYSDRGEEHSSTLNARSNLAWLDWRRGRLAEAEAEHRRILEIRERTLGSERSATASTLYHLARAITDQGRDEEAEPLLKRALQIRETRRGEHHRTVGDTLLELGDLARRTGRPDEARRLLRRALDIYRETLPPGHRDLQRATEALASIDG